MSMYKKYIEENEERKGEGLNPKPIEGAEVMSEIIDQIGVCSKASLGEGYGGGFKTDAIYPAMRSLVD